MRLTGHLTCRVWGQKPKGRTTVKKCIKYHIVAKKSGNKAKCIFLMKFDTCARRHWARREAGKVRVSLSQVWAVSWAWKMWKAHLQQEQQQQRTMKGTKGNGEGKEPKLQWMKNQLGACNFENALGGLSWLTDWMNDLTAWTTRTADYRLLTADWWLLTVDWWNDWLLHWQSGQSLQQQRSWWNSCSLIRKSRSNCKKIHRKLWDTILSSERYATNVAIIQFY